MLATALLISTAASLFVSGDPDFGTIDFNKGKTQCMQDWDPGCYKRGRGDEGGCCNPGSVCVQGSSNFQVCAQPDVLGLSRPGHRCDHRGNTQLERDNMCQGYHVCARKGHEGRNFGCDDYFCCAYPDDAYWATYIAPACVPNKDWTDYQGRDCAWYGAEKERCLILGDGHYTQTNIAMEQCCECKEGPLGGPAFNEPGASCTSNTEFEMVGASKIPGSYHRNPYKKAEAWKVNLAAPPAPAVPAVPEMACGVETCRDTDYSPTCPAGKVCGWGGCYSCPPGRHHCPRDQGFYSQTCENEKQCHRRGCVDPHVTGVDQATYLQDKAMCCTSLTEQTEEEEVGWYFTDDFGWEPTYTTQLGGLFEVYGDCDVKDYCVSSGNYPNDHEDNEECKINILKDVEVTSGEQFDIEKCCDHLIINGVDVESKSQIPATLSAGDHITWDSDNWKEGSGWQLCLSTEETRNNNWVDCWWFEQEVGRCRGPQGAIPGTNGLTANDVCCVCHYGKPVNRWGRYVKADGSLEDGWSEEALAESPKTRKEKSVGSKKARMRKTNAIRKETSVASQNARLKKTNRALKQALNALLD